jgi:transcriptional regulator with XRE-family HTH domain
MIDACLTSKSIAQGARFVKYRVMPKPGKHLTEPYVRWIEAEMARREWKPAELARRAKVNQGVLSRMLRREVATDITTLQRLAKALGGQLPALQPVAAEHLSEGQVMAPRMPQERPSGVGEGAGRPPHQAAREPVASGGVSLKTQAVDVLAGLEALAPAMQRQAVVRAFQRGLESQDVFGRGLLRVTIVLCDELRRMGYPLIATEIEAEVGRETLQVVKDTEEDP